MRATSRGVEAGQLGGAQGPEQPSGLGGEFLSVGGRERGGDEVPVAEVLGVACFRGP